jgi:5-methyltetrahydropteroyltriglutamate--homocysteine methyltransferase
MPEHMMSNISDPPFRADHVGSLLRPEAVKDARAKFAAGKLGADQLKEIEDRAIENAIRRQEEIGLDAITDGEMRREMWHWDFLAGLDGVQLRESSESIRFHGATIKPKTLAITGKIGISDVPLLDHFRFLRERTRGTAKMTIPSPAMLFSVARDWREALDQKIYADQFATFDDLAAAYRKAIRAFYDAGCRYLQLDECNLPMLCDESYHKKARARGDDPQALIEGFARLINASLKDRPSDMTITIHTCRGNFRSTWMAEGSYDPVAKHLFGSLDVDGFFAEYDSDRSGGFQPLEYLPKDKRIVLGLVSSKAGELESPDAIKRKIDEATKYVGFDQICLSPQCGFSSSEEGNVLTEDQQWRKLAFVKEMADKILSRN